MRHEGSIIHLLAGLLNGVWKLGGGRARAPFWLLLVVLSAALYGYYRFVMGAFD